jgi:hypothetical protein
VITEIISRSCCGPFPRSRGTITETLLLVSGKESVCPGHTEVTVNVNSPRTEL